MRKRQIGKRSILKPVKSMASLAEELDRQAFELRKMASGWCASATPPAVSLFGIECSNFVLSYTDLIDDAQALEADASKLRAVYT